MCQSNIRQHIYNKKKQRVEERNLLPKHTILFLLSLLLYMYNVTSSTVLNFYTQKQKQSIFSSHSLSFPCKFQSTIVTVGVFFLFKNSSKFRIFIGLIKKTFNVVNMCQEFMLFGSYLSPKFEHFLFLFSDACKTHDMSSLSLSSSFIALKQRF